MAGRPAPACATLNAEIHAGHGHRAERHGPAHASCWAAWARWPSSSGASGWPRVGLAWLAARTFPVGRLRRSLLALLTVLGYVLIVGLAVSVAWETLDYGGTWGTQSRRLAESAVRLRMFLAFVVGLGRALLANRPLVLAPAADHRRHGVAAGAAALAVGLRRHRGRGCPSR